VGLERSGYRLWRSGAPELVDDSIDGDDPIGVDKQQGQQGTLLGRPYVDAFAVVGHHEWAKDPKLHRNSALISCANRVRRHLRACPLTLPDAASTAPMAWAADLGASMPPSEPQVRIKCALRPSCHGEKIKFRHERR
jgi:hypothetical protein